MGFFRDPESPRDRDFKFWAKLRNPENSGIGIGIWKSRKIPKIPKKSRVENPKNPEIPEIGIGMWKPQKNSEKISRAKSRKSHNPGNRDTDLKMLKRFGRNPENFLPSGFFIPGIGIFWRNGMRATKSQYCWSVKFCWIPKSIIVNMKDVILVDFHKPR